MSLTSNRFALVYDISVNLYTTGTPTVTIPKTDLSSQFTYPPPHPPVPDAVIHFAAYARNMLVPDNETFRGNVLSTYNVIEAACKLGVKKIIIASCK